MSTPPKDIARAIGVYYCPPHLSNEDFERNMERLVDALLVLPVAQRNIINYEMCVSKNSYDKDIQAIGFTTPLESMIVLIVDCKTEADLAEYLQDPQVSQLFNDGITEELGFGPSRSFGVHAITKIQDMSPPNTNLARIIGVYRCPPNLSNEEFERKAEHLIDTEVALPVVQKSVTKYEMSVSNNLHEHDQHLQRLGLATPTESTIVVCADYRTEEDMAKYFQDPQVIQFCKDAMEEPTLKQSHTFGACVITKIRK
ncbi:hypothetical protein C8J57DRAFT_1270708 [Mycena rebaudengoi]|nr:hypothetical protein C8J57DRAFT_1270708 [Mycena rebaudengoi]